MGISASTHAAVAATDAVKVPTDATAAAAMPMDLEEATCCLCFELL